MSFQRRFSVAQPDSSFEERPKRRNSIQRFGDRVRPHVQSLTAAANSTRLAKPERERKRRESTAGNSEAPNLYTSLLRSRTLRKMPKTNNLSINVVPGTDGATRSGLTSPRTPLTPLSPRAANDNKGRNQYGEGYDNHIHSPINALPPPPASPRSPKAGSSVASKIFGNKLASKSATRLGQKFSHGQSQSPEGGSPSLPIQIPQSPSNTHLYGIGGLSGGGGLNKSSPDLGVVSVSYERSGQSSPGEVSASPEQQLSHSATSATLTEHSKAASRKTQHKFGNFLHRKSSLHGAADTPTISLSTEQFPPPTRSGKEKPKPGPIKPITQPIDVPVRTAPVEKERGFRSAMNSAMNRNRSLDRAEDISAERMGSSQGGHGHKPSSLGPNGASGGSMMSNIRSGSTRAAEGISKAKKGIWGGLSKLNRSGSSHESSGGRPMLQPGEPYELKVLVLPLEEQARMTRIAKRLHYCKDKTEFWLPAFPYRCIDYLSDRGTYSEGLYRVPGSELEIKHYMARFDREYDLDLFDQPDLHDVNVVATMLKRWLSNLPPVLPIATQTSIIQHCAESHPSGVAGATTPAFMKEALSNLPPWNYYLLFAITGHISFLHNHREQNKMTYENLFRCFGTRALQVEPYIFWWLVWDWRGCWAGCAREEEFKIKEYEVLDKMAEDEHRERTDGSNGRKQQKEEVVKKDSKEDIEREKKEKQRKQSVKVSGLSKQSVSGHSREKSRPQTAHAHSNSLISATSKNQQQPPVPRKVSPDRREQQQQQQQQQQSPASGREPRRSMEERQERALSSSDSSKPSITGQSSAGTERDEEVTTEAHQINGHEARKEKDKREKSEDGNLKSTDMRIPMLSPLKPLSPMSLH